MSQTNTQDSTLQAAASGEARQPRDRKNAATGNTTPAADAAASASETANTTSHADAINAQYDAQDAAATAQIDAQTDRSVQQTEAAYTTGQEDLRQQYNATTAAQYTAMDNRALTDQYEGRYGGVAGAGLSAVAQSYQAERDELSREQLALASSTADQVEALRAQGEFDKADALLKSSQQRFAALYADALRVDENAAANARYAQEQALQQESDAYSRTAAQQDALRDTGYLLLQYGVVPPKNILQAMGLTEEVAKTLAKQGLKATLR